MRDKQIHIEAHDFTVKVVRDPSISERFPWAFFVDGEFINSGSDRSDALELAEKYVTNCEITRVTESIKRHFKHDSKLRKMLDDNPDPTDSAEYKAWGANPQ